MINQKQADDMPAHVVLILDEAINMLEQVFPRAISRQKAQRMFVNAYFLSKAELEEKDLI